MFFFSISFLSHTKCEINLPRRTVVQWRVVGQRKMERKRLGTPFLTATYINLSGEPVFLRNCYCREWWCGGKPTHLSFRRPGFNSRPRPATLGKLPVVFLPPPREHRCGTSPYRPRRIPSSYPSFAFTKLLLFLFNTSIFFFSSAQTKEAKNFQETNPTLDGLFVSVN